MITEQELKERCTSEFIKWMCELAEGFIWCESYIETPNRIVSIKEIFSAKIIFPLLIHRAVEGWNKKSYDSEMKFIGFQIDSVTRYVKPKTTGRYIFNEYKTQFLIQSECAMLDCLLDIFKEIRP